MAYLDLVNFFLSGVLPLRFFFLLQSSSSPFIIFGPPARASPLQISLSGSVGRFHFSSLVRNLTASSFFGGVLGRSRRDPGWKPPVPGRNRPQSSSKLCSSDARPSYAHAVNFFRSHMANSLVFWLKTSHSSFRTCFLFRSQFINL